MERAAPTRQSAQVFAWATSFPSQGTPPRLRPPAMHNHQLLRTAWLTRPSEPGSSPCFPRMQPHSFADSCAQAASRRSTSTRRSGRRCCTASFFDPSTTRSWRCLELFECCFRMHMFPARPAHAHVRHVFVRCDGDVSGRPLCGAARVCTTAARADMGMYPLCARHMSTVGVLLMFTKCWYIIYHA